MSPLPTARDKRLSSRDSLVVLLTVSTGAVDGTSFLHLGHVFSSVVTGTMVLLGLAAGTHDASLAEHCGVALASYTTGVLLGAPLAARPAGHRAQQAARRHQVWSPSVTLTLVAEFVLVAAFCAGWEVASGRPQGTAQLPLLAVLGAAMGMQGAAIRQLGQISTTYLTGTLTGVVADLATRRTPEGLARSLGIFLALITGAFLAAILTAAVPALLPVVVLTPLALVVALAGLSFRVTGGRIIRRRRPGRDG